MLYLISLGLYDKKDISLRAIEACKKCSKLYFEGYTSFYGSSLKELEKIFGKKIISLKREEVESDFLIKESKKKNVGLLVIGDALTATTHSSFILDKAKVVHGSSILTAVGETGLMLYNFGKVTSIPFDNKNVKEPYNVLVKNKDLHTLFLLDLQNGKYMSVSEGVKYLLRQGMGNRLVVGCGGLGSDKREIKVCKAKDMVKKKFKLKPQCIIVPGKLHFVEEEILDEYMS